MGNRFVSHGIGTTTTGGILPRLPPPALIVVLVVLLAISVRTRCDSLGLRRAIEERSEKLLNEVTNCGNHRHRQFGEIVRTKRERFDALTREFDGILGRLRDYARQEYVRSVEQTLGAKLTNEDYLELVNRVDSDIERCRMEHKRQIADLTEKVEAATGEFRDKLREIQDLVIEAKCRAERCEPDEGLNRCLQDVLNELGELEEVDLTSLNRTGEVIAKEMERIGAEVTSHFDHYVRKSIASCSNLPELLLQHFMDQLFYQ